MRLPDPPVLLITDRAQMRQPFEDVVGVVLAAGCRWVSLREKHLNAAERLALTRQLTALARAYGATVTVHGDYAAARAADGIHLSGGGSVAEARRRLGSDALIGLSIHDPAEIERAAGEGADYVTLSPIFASLSKTGYGPGPGLNGLRRATSMNFLPVIALGGVEPENAPLCRAAGACGVAVTGAILMAEDPGVVARLLVECFA